MQSSTSACSLSLVFISRCIPGLLLLLFNLTFCHWPLASDFLSGPSVGPLMPSVATHNPPAAFSYTPEVSSSFKMFQFPFFLPAPRPRSLTHIISHVPSSSYPTWSRAHQVWGMAVPLSRKEAFWSCQAVQGGTYTALIYIWEEASMTVKLEYCLNSEKATKEVSFGPGLGQQMTNYIGHISW